MLCNYLFFKGCELGVKTKSFGDYPVLAGAATVSMWLVFNIGSVLLLITHHFNFSFSINRYVGAFVVFGGSTIYYSINGRGKKLIKKYNSKRDRSLIYNLNPYIVVSGALLLSAGVLVFVGMYVNDFK